MTRKSPNRLDKESYSELMLRRALRDANPDMTEAEIVMLRTGWTYEEQKLGRKMTHQERSATLRRKRLSKHSMKEITKRRTDRA